MPIDASSEVDAPADSIAGAKIIALQRRWPPGILLMTDRQSDYYALPLLLLEAFPPLTPAAVEPLLFFCRLYAGSLFLQDKLIDGVVPPPYVASISLRIMAMQAEAYGVLHRLFPSAAPFWDRFQGYMAEYAASCLDERSFAERERRLAEYTEEVGLRIVVGKNCPSRSIVAALAELACDDRRLEVVNGILDEFNKAIQLWDDLQDWKDDLRSRRPSLVIARIVPELPGALDEADWKALLAEAGRRLYYGDHARAILDRGIAALDAIVRCEADVPQLGLYAKVNALRRRYEVLRRDLDRIVRDNIQRARCGRVFELRLPRPADESQALAWGALRFLVQQWQLGFGEARDLSVFSPGSTLGDGETCYTGDVLQRALIAEALADADETLGGVLRPILAQEADELIRQRIPDAFGGFRYFVDLPELPPDADTLANVMLALLRSGRQGDVARHCEGALAVLLRDGGHPDGSIDTWIVPAAERSLLQERHAERVERLLGPGPDCDVVAGLLYALHRYDAGRFEGVVARGVRYLESEQHKDGTWPSRRYAGHYYTLYVCLRVLSEARPHAPSVARALDFLKARQRHDGGFGIDGRPSDALSTALALLGIAAGAKASHDPDRDERASQALAFLVRVTNGGQAFAPQHLIINCAGAKHGSRTLTASFVLKAALIARRACCAPGGAAVGGGRERAPEEST